MFVYYVCYVRIRKKLQKSQRNLIKGCPLKILTTVIPLSHQGAMTMSSDTMIGYVLPIPK